MKTKKRILFVSYEMILGGVERALVSALSLIPEDEFDVTLMLTKRGGALLAEVPEHVTVQEVPFHPLDDYMFQHGRMAVVCRALLSFHWLYLAQMLWRRLLWMMRGRPGDFTSLVVQDAVKRIDLQKMPGDFDYAFAYAGEYLTSAIVRYCVSAAVTAVWFHNERGGGDSRFYESVYRHFTHRFACSESMRGVLLKRPWMQCADVEVMPHYIDPARYRTLAAGGVGFQDRFMGLRILTVGRITRQKGIDRALEVAEKLRTEVLNFRWYVIGEGDELARLREVVKAKALEDVFVLLGPRVNPYPYYEQCDVYVQPSRWEAYCLTLAEARAFNRPIVTTDFAGATEQIKNGTTGIIVPTDDMASLTESVRALLTSKSRRKELSAALEMESGETCVLAKRAWMNLLQEGAL